MKKLLFLTALLASMFMHGQDYQNYLKIANDALESGDARKANENANKALELQPTSVDARWVRVRSSLTANASEKAINGSIDDLKFIIANGRGTARVYNALGVAETEAGSYIYRFKHAKSNNTISDDKSAYIKEQKAYYTDAINHYKSAKIAYQKAIELNPDDAKTYTYKANEAEKYIKEIAEKAATLK